MDQLIRKKVLLFDRLVEKVDQLKKQGKVVVQTHGVFDLIHPGITQHLALARKQGDICVATVIKDKDVRRGPGRPIFNETLRAENLAALNLVDYVTLVDDETPFECVRILKPDVFARGQSQNERDHKIHEKIFKQEKELYFGKSKLFETGVFSYSSSQFINNFTENYSPEVREFLKDFSEKYSFNNIVDRLNQLKKLKVVLIGDGIIDEYHYCEPMGKSAKSNLVVSKYVDHEIFAGGAFAIANHVASICEKVQLVSLLGEEDSREEFIRNNLKPNVKAQLFSRSDGPTVIKKRYIHKYLNQKLHEINYLNDQPVNEKLEKKIIKYLSTHLPKFDLVLVSDFGHGFISPPIYDAIEKHAKILAINAQTNGANTGYNLITKYHNPNYACLDEPEVRLAAQAKYQNIDEVASSIRERLNADYLITTQGKKGSIGVNRENQFNRTPIFSTRVIDTVGAGDAFFAYTAPCFAQKMPLDFVSFIGNAVGALAVQIMGNKKAVEKSELLEFVNALLK